ncbi:MAG TPA: hypothetical protein VNU19_06800 [Candidatus Acidoferrum sp.]|jgi:hypothetical protein|nr:hypothetical protein [Candidatus Acidoferrum sp.]
MGTHIFLHGFGARYDLPAPLAIYIFAAGGVVVISFVLVVLFASSQRGEEATRYPRVEAWWLASLANSRLLRVIGGLIGVLSLVTVITTGLFGAQDPLRNPSAYLVWIYLWVALVVISALIGNLWIYLNPFAAVYDLGRQLVKFPSRIAILPERLGIWPAAVLFFGIAWLELASGKASTPAVIGSLALAYTVFTLAGMVIFGRDTWLSRCEPFTVLFGIASRFSPTEVERNEEGTVKKAYLRPWGVGLLQPVQASWDLIVFVILMLSNLAFDGLEATPLWFSLLAHPALATTLEVWWRPVVYTAGLLAVAVIFVVAFVGCTRLILIFGKGKVNPLAVTSSFALTLVPIALAYDLAHNYTYLVIEGQAFIPTLADPFAKGWSLLPVQNYQPNLALAGPETVWLLQVILIVLGHVVAVYLAHFRASQWFRTSYRVLMSQYPMLVLMVLYTMTSLWILAQPITSGG